MYIVSKNTHESFKSFMKIKEEKNELEKSLFQKSFFYLNFIKWIPGLQMIGVCNSLSMLATHKDSDIDLFVITKKNRLWTVRILLTFFFFLVGQRKTGKNHAGNFCLSFFTGETAFNLENIAIENDIYLFHWMLYLKPIINYNHTYESFIDSNSKWCNLKDFKEIIEANKKYIKYKRSTSKNWLIGDAFEFIFKSIFLKRTLKKYDQLGSPFGVIITDHMLKFHNDDTRKEIRKNFS